MKAPYPRHRQSSDLFTSNYSSITYDRDAVPLPTETKYTDTGIPGGQVRVMDDFVTPGFASLSKQGRIINNPMYSYRWMREYSQAVVVDTMTLPTPGRYTVTHIGAYTAILDKYGPVFPDGALLKLRQQLDSSRDAQVAGINARKNISPSLVMSLVSIAESPKTFRMLSGALKDVAALAKAAVSGNRKDLVQVDRVMRRRRLPTLSARARQLWRDTKQDRLVVSAGSLTLAKRWLELRYGWTPAVMDVLGVLKALDPKRKLLPERATARGFSSHEKSIKLDGSVDLGARGIENFATRHTDSVASRAWCIYIADLNYQSYRDFGVTDILTAGYELVPYSFVLDWFINVGDWLEALQPKVGIKILAEGVVTKQILTCVRVLTSHSPPSSGGLQYSSTGQTGLRDMMQSTVVRRSPNLDVIYQLPPVDVKLNIKRTLDAFALFRGQAAGLKLGRGFD